jgi:hypothetical protein
MQNEKKLPIAECALNHVGFRAAMHPTWCMADRDMPAKKSTSLNPKPKIGS